MRVRIPALSTPIAISFVALMVVLVVSTWGVHALATRAGRGQFELETTRRVEKQVRRNAPELVEPWRRGDHRELKTGLSRMIAERRSLGAAMCGPAGEVLVAPRLVGEAPSCEEVARRSLGDGSPWWFVESELPGGPVQVSAVPLDDSEGFVAVFDDMSKVERREAGLDWLIAIEFIILTLAASAATLVAVHASWRRWTDELRDALRGQQGARAFQPLLRDVHELAERLAAESSADSGAWNADRLRAVLARYLSGDRILVLANREPYVHQHTPEGVRVLHPASGLVTALEPVMRACSGVWVAHGSGTADRETVDERGLVWAPPGEESYQIRRVWLSEAEEQGYYYGFSNEGLWPLCHLAHHRPSFRRSDWECYRAVNQRFAEAVVEQAVQDDPVVLVQDYHFALAPTMIRKLLPRATILTFWHIPWPNYERFGICPWRNEVIEGLLGSSIVGFHTQQHCNNFLDAVDAYIECRIDREENAVIQGTRRTLVRPYPISIEWPVHWLEGLPPAAECRKAVREELGLAPDTLLGIGVDRLDYTKGIEERLLAVEHLLEEYPEFVGRFVFVQLAAPSRTRIPRYQQLNDMVEEIAARVNQRFARGDYHPIVLLRAHHEPPTVYRYFRAANVCYVSSLHDGMNLVAKEFVAAREDLRGVLVLSQFTGAARELTEALVVNPYDLDEASAAMAAALRMPEREQADRMRSMRALVSELNVYRWAGRMLIDAATLRRKERLSGRLSTWNPAEPA